MEPNTAAGDLFLGVYGQFTPHTPRPEGAGDADAYSLFNSYAEALGWSHSGAAPSGAELWGMADAGQNHAAGATQAAWFHVVPLGPSGQAGVVPVTQVVLCAEKALARLGELTLQGVQLLVPLQLRSSAPGNLFSRCGIFDSPASSPPARVSVRIDSGSDDACTRLAPAIRATVEQFAAGLIAPEPNPPDPDVAAALDPPVLDKPMWIGEGEHAVSLTLAVPELTLDLCAWLADYLAYACRAAGAATPVLISIAHLPH